MDKVPNPARTQRVNRLAALMREQYNLGLLLWALERIRVEVSTTGPTQDMRAFLDDLFAALDLVEAEHRVEREQLLAEYAQMPDNLLVGAR